MKRWQIGCYDQRMDGSEVIPIIDVFAGPGGLGEGFSALTVNGLRPFRIALSIEKDPVAHETLELRAFFRQFPTAEAPEEYYEHLRGKVDRHTLYAKRPEEALAARREAWCAELGKTDDFPDDLIDKRIQRALRRHRHKESLWVLIGGPPCQAYSLIGRARMGQAHIDTDDRTTLYKQYLRIIDRHKPSLFVMENVKGLLSATRRGESMFERILDDLQHPSGNSRREYDVLPLVDSANGEALSSNSNDADRFVIKSEQFGIPQARHRVILVGVRRSLRMNRFCLHRQPQAITVLDVIGDLPPIRSTLSREPDSYDQWRRYIRRTLALLDGLRDPVLRNLMNQSTETRVLDTGAEFIPWRCRPRKLREWLCDNRLGGVCNHSARGHIGADLQRYLFAACFAAAHGASPTLHGFPVSLRPMHANVNGNRAAWIFTDRFRVQRGDAVSSTVTSHISKDGHYYIHYDPKQCRSLTVREAARLQTFPDNYFLCGPRTEQYRQVGNAVPPLLAMQIASAVYAMLRSAQSRRKAKHGSALQRT